MKKEAQVGKKGTGSDCCVHLEIKESGGIKIELKSKVESMYGKAIRDTVKKMMKFFGIKNALLNV